MENNQRFTIKSISRLIGYSVNVKLNGILIQFEKMVTANKKFHSSIKYKCLQFLYENEGHGLKVKQNSNKVGKNLDYFKIFNP